MSIDRTKILEQAQKHLAKGALDKAIAEYLRLVQADPSDVRTWLKIGDLYTQRGQKREAIETYARVADTYAQQGFFLKAVAVYKQILKLDPGLLEAQLRLGEMYEQLALVSDALGTYEQVAQQYARAGQIDKALATLGRMAELDPDNVPVRIKLAEGLSKAGRTDDAAREFEAGCRLLEEQGRIDDFIKVAERLLYHRPNDAALSKKLARLYLERGDAKRALGKLQVAFKADAKDVETLELLADAFLGLQQLPKTLSVLKEIARIHADAKRPAARMAVLRRILELDPGDPDARQAVAAAARESTASQAALVAPPSSAVVGGPGSDEDDDDLMEGLDDRRVHEGVRAAGRGDALDARDEAEAADDLDEGEVVDADEEDILIEEDDEPVAARAPAAPQASTRGGGTTAASARGTPSAGMDLRATDAQRDAQITRMLGEVDVFKRYGLRQKVLEQLERVVAMAPDHVEARERLAGAYADAGRPLDAARQLAALADAFLDDDPQVAVTYLRRVVALNPADEDARGKLALLDEEEPALPESGAAAPAAPPEPRPAASDLASAAAAAAAAEVTDHALGAEPGADDDAVMFVEDEGGRESTPAAAAPPNAPPDFDDATLYESVPRPGPGAFGLPPTTPSARRDPRIVTAVTVDETVGPATVLEHRLDDDTGEDVRPFVPPAVSAPLPRATADVGGREPERAAQPAGYVPPPPRASIRPPGPASPDIEDVLEEAEFFVAQGLFDEARQTLGDALAAHPGHRLLLEKLAEVEDLAAGGSGDVGPAPDSIEPGEADDAFLLAEKLAEELGPAEPTGAVADVLDVDQVFAQFKKGVEENIGLEDSDTHFDLGIAYKEMGLLDDAIHEFKLAMSNPQKECLAETMIGLCFVEKGQIAEAISHFKKGLYSDNKNDREELGLYFELGVAYEMLQDPKEALYYFQKVQKRDPSFRGVGAKIKALLQPRPPAAAAPAPPQTSAEDVDRAFDDLLGDGDKI